MKNLLALGVVLLSVVGCGPSPAGTKEKPATLPAAQVVVPETRPATTVVVAKPEAARGPVVKVNRHTDLWNDYEANEAAADLKYTDKTVELVVEGVVRKGPEGYYLACNVVDSFPDEFSPAVWCYVRPADVGKAAAAGAFPLMKIRGVCEGRSPDPRAWHGFRVTIRDAEILSKLKWTDGQKYEEVP